LTPNVNLKPSWYHYGSGKPHCHAGPPDVAVGQALDSNRTTRPSGRKRDPHLALLSRVSSSTEYGSARCWWSIDDPRFDRNKTDRVLLCRIPWVVPRANRRYAVSMLRPQTRYTMWPKSKSLFTLLNFKVIKSISIKTFKFNGRTYVIYITDYLFVYWSLTINITIYDNIIFMVDIFVIIYL